VALLFYLLKSDELVFMFMDGRLTSPKIENTSLIRDVKESRKLLCFAASYLKIIHLIYKLLILKAV